MNIQSTRPKFALKSAKTTAKPTAQGKTCTRESVEEIHGLIDKTDLHTLIGVVPRGISFALGAATALAGVVALATGAPAGLGKTLGMLGGMGAVAGVLGYIGHDQYAKAGAAFDKAVKISEETGCYTRDELVQMLLDRA